ncbi:MAG: peptidoglycan bridge formation glycyltransferase FemA/FemB family protein [Chloroflexota bacterium]|nr:peptidoglycan bridge formation glycyltransferase FemA/FemB family protein [Chloroflexota bacterium]
MLESIRSIDSHNWDSFVARYSGAHMLQTSPWGALKAQFGWDVERVGLTQEGELVAGAQVLYRRLPLGLGCLAYVPKGPLVDWAAEGQLAALLALLNDAARSRSAVALTLEPDFPDDPAHRERLRARGFCPSLYGSVQPRRTLIVDIAPDEKDILMTMKSKTRYNTRLAGRRGVTVRAAAEADLPAFYDLMSATAERGDFGVHSPAYYEAAYRLFAPQGRARLLLAEVEGEAAAAVMAFALPPRSWYFYGASGNAHREKMPTYLLQWEAMRWAKSQGCATYDMYGVPDEDVEELEAKFTKRRDGLWPIYRFKRGFGGRLTRSVGAWDRVYAPLRYRLLSTAYSMLSLWRQR